MKAVVTHYSRRIPDKEHWITLPIVTRRLGEGTGPYFFGLDTSGQFSAEDIQEKEASGGLKRLPRPYVLPDDKALWLTPELDVFIASETNPIADSSKILIDTDVLPDSPEERVRQFDIKNRVRKEILRRSPQSLVVIDEGYLARPLYQKLVQNMTASLENIANAIGVSIIPKGKFRLETLPAYMNAFVFDFCRDPYFLTEERENDVDVVPFGELRSFTFAFNKQGQLPIGFLKENEKPFAERLITFLHQTTADVEVEILGETAAAMEVMHVVRRLPALTERVTIQPDTVTLRFRLQEKPQHRIAIVDHGIARQLETMSSNLVEERYPVPLKWNTDEVFFIKADTTFSFRKPIPVGFMFQRKWPAWGLDIKTAFASALKTLWCDAPWERRSTDTSSIMEELAMIGVNAFSLHDICDSLGISEFHFSQLKEEIADALRGNDDDRVNKLRAQLAEIKKAI
jgi:hypothetical protein